MKVQNPNQKIENSRAESTFNNWWNNNKSHNGIKSLKRCRRLEYKSVEYLVTFIRYKHHVTVSFFPQFDFMIRIKFTAKYGLLDVHLEWVPIQHWQFSSAKFESLTVFWIIIKFLFGKMPMFCKYHTLNQAASYGSLRVALCKTKNHLQMVQQNWFDLDLLGTSS